MAVKILVIGVGNMGSSLIAGVSKQKLGYAIEAYDSNALRLEAARVKDHFKVLDLSKTKKIDHDAVILAVKPQDLGSVANLIAGKVSGGSLVLSFLAGVPMATIRAELRHKGAVVRAMPNIAALVHEATTACVANEDCSEKHKRLAQQLFEALGDVHWTKESAIDAVTGLSGSGPAYVYMMIEALSDGGVKMGLPRKLSDALAIQTMLGAAKLAKVTGSHPAVLKDQVTTPGGTTIAAVYELERCGLRAMLMSAVEIATKRAAELRQK